MRVDGDRGVGIGVLPSGVMACKQAPYDLIARTVSLARRRTVWLSNRH